MSLTYSSYLKLDTLLTLQTRKASTTNNDELLFIIIHQTYELWFKELLHEFEHLRDYFLHGKSAHVVRKFRRILSILKLAVQQTDILETMRPTDFSKFRTLLENSSGLQSFQFREIEILCGWRHKPMYKIFENEEFAHKRIKQRLKETTLWEAFCTFLNKYEPNIKCQKIEDVEIGLCYTPSSTLQQSLLRALKKHQLLDIIIEHMIDLDEGLQEWRYRHVKMVERIIGTQSGTGGSSGVEYLKSTLHRQIFPDLWAIRDKL